MALESYGRPYTTAPMETGDVVMLAVPRAPYGAEPLGAIERIDRKKSVEPSDERVYTLVWVAMDNGDGDQPFLVHELLKVDVPAWEAKFAGDWACKCSGERLNAQRVVCPNCGRARPWK